MRRDQKLFSTPTSFSIADSITTSRKAQSTFCSSENSILHLALRGNDWNDWNLWNGWNHRGLAARNDGDSRRPMANAALSYHEQQRCLNGKRARIGFRFLNYTIYPADRRPAVEFLPTDVDLGFGLFSHNPSVFRRDLRSRCLNGCQLDAGTRGNNQHPRVAYLSFLCKPPLCASRGINVAHFFDDYGNG